jgi:predicted ATPase/DNA-binding CsgD family transcriptional regulator
MDTASLGGNAVRAPLPSPGAVGRLPLPLTSLLARDAEIAGVGALLQRHDVRLLTLTGPGGVGKTRIAIAVANALSPVLDSLTFVALAPVRDPALVSPTIAQALGVLESGEWSAPERLERAIGNTAMLLVLDNFEHLLDAASLVTELLTACPRLTILTTSRAPLHVSGEREYPVTPLALPDPNAQAPHGVADAPAVRLFVERATAVDPDFTLGDDNAAAVAAICVRLDVRLDGLPLAIELAAARSKALPPGLLLSRMAWRLPLLTGGPRDVPGRLQTMREAIAWSHELLTPDERGVFRRLAVFSGGFTLEAAEAICQAMAAPDPPGVTPSVLEAISSLVDKSLLQRHHTVAGVRFSMLETIREFAFEQLAAMGEEDQARAVHAAYFSSLGTRLDPNQIAPGERFDDRLWNLEADLANFRAALTHLAGTSNAEDALRLAGGLAVFWHHRGNLTEGRQWLEWALDHTVETATANRARALAGLSLIQWSQGEHESAVVLAEAALEVARALDHTELTALSLHLLGMAALAQFAWDRAAALMAEALRLWRTLGLQSGEAMALRSLAGIAYETGEVEACARWCEEALTIFRAVEHPSGTSAVLGLSARLAHDQEDYHSATLAYQEGLRHWTQTDARWSATEGLGTSGEATVFPRWAGIDDRRFLLLALSGLAGIAVTHDQRDLAAQLLGAVDRRWSDAAMIVPRIGSRHDETKTTARAALGERTFAAHFATGRQLRLNDAVALALTITVPTPVGAGPAPWPPALRDSMLTNRQVEVLRLLIEGRSDREIGAALFLSRRTVQDHVSHLIAKLGVANRTEAAAVAVRDQLV